MCQIVQKPPAWQEELFSSVFGDSNSVESNYSIRLVEYAVPKLGRNGAPLQPREFDFKVWASNTSKLIQKPGETFFPVNRSSILSENRDIPRRRKLGKYENFGTEWRTATALSLQLSKSRSRSSVLEVKAQGDFLSHQEILISSLSIWKLFFTEYWSKSTKSRWSHKRNFRINSTSLGITITCVEQVVLIAACYFSAEIMAFLSTNEIPASQFQQGRFWFQNGKMHCLSTENAFAGL